MIVLVAHLRGGYIQTLRYLSVPDKTSDDVGRKSASPDCHSGSDHHNGRVSSRSPMHVRQMVRWLPYLAGAHTPTRPSHHVYREDNHALVPGSHADYVLR